ncbi:MAG: type III pantothenate kinase [Flavobacterium sp.]|uniref:type III pantothenate kinase n=1 Tax=Flavobacterium TaxID=237 RepID=UPI0039189CFF
MLLAVDVGNTLIKSAVFEHDTLLELFYLEYEDVPEKINFILCQHPKIEVLVVSSVGKLDGKIFNSFKNKVKVYEVSRQDKFPFQNLYSTPETLGLDRMILASGATLQYPDQNRLVIDAGTCITYDFINDQNQYLGGAISPGIRLRYESLHQYTAKLPLLTKKHPENTIGNSTNESIHSGVVNGILHEIDGFIEAYQSQYAKFIIILTGGDADFLAKQLKNTIFANSNFLLESLNQTFQYNQK